MIHISCRANPEYSDRASSEIDKASATPDCRILRSYGINLKERYSMWTKRSARLSWGCVSSFSDIKEWRERPGGSSWRHRSKASESSLTCFHENLASKSWCGLAIALISAILLSCACTVPKKTGLPFPIRGSTNARRSNFCYSWGLLLKQYRENSSYVPSLSRHCEYQCQHWV